MVVRAVVENVEEGTYGIEGAVVLDRNDGGLVFSAITTVSDNGNTVIMSNGYEMDISDATIIYVDSKNGAAITDGDVKVALKNYDLNGDPYMANALFIGENNGDCELLVVDQGQYLESDYYDDTIGVTGTNTVYGKDKAPAAETKDYVDLTYSINKRGDLIVNALADRPNYVPDDASIEVNANVYVDGTYAEPITFEIPANMDSARKTAVDYYEEGDDVTLEDVTITPSKVVVNYVFEDGVGAVTNTSATTLGTSGNNTLNFQLNTGDYTAALSYEVEGTNQDGAKAWNGNADDQQTVNNVKADGDQAVTITIKGTTSIPVEKKVSVIASQDALADNVKLSSLGTVNAADADKTIYISKPAAAVDFTSADMAVEVELTVSAKLTQAIDVTLNTDDVIRINAKTGTTTGSKTITFDSSCVLEIESVELVDLPTVTGVQIVKDDDTAYTSTDTSYAANSKIVITFSEVMDTSKSANELLTITAGAGTGNEYVPTLGTADWSADKLSVEIPLSGYGLDVPDILTIKGAASDTTGNVMAEVTYTVGAPGSTPVKA